jgi:two-component system sensor histidine kinase PilS (NtrC family)
MITETKTLPAAASLPERRLRGREPGETQATGFDELSNSLLRLIGFRSAVVFLALNLAEPLGILPSRLGPFASLPLINLLNMALSAGYLVLWWSGRHLQLQAYFQITLDLLITTVLVAGTRGIDSAFVSFYLLIVTYCSLILGRNRGMVAAALSAIFYSGVIIAGHLEMPAGPRISLLALAFRLSFHAVGFFAVAYLGANLSHRLHAVQEELEQNKDSFEQLQRLNELIVSSIRSGLITTDLTGNIAVFNSTAEELTERKQSKALGRPVQQILGDSLWSRIRGANFFQSPKALRHEDWIVLPGGTQRYLGFSISPLLDPARCLLGYIISFQDLTEIKRLEEEIRVKERMAVVGQMAAGIAHEIRNPLTSMRGSVELLRSHLDVPRNDERLFDIILRESDRLNKFVEDFLVFARPGKYARRRMDLVPLLKDCVTLLRNNPEVQKKHPVTLSLEAAQIHVCGSPDQLRQVFWNIAQNALRAMPVGGPLAITARMHEDGGAEVDFKDSGIGMSEEERVELFQPFHSGFVGGTGLGLSITFQIMQDHNGRISIESEKGRGTTVKLYLPPDSQPDSSVRVQ